MPTVQPGNTKVLVSGANGFIATWVVRTLLEKGYAVRGTVRSVDKGKHLKQQFESYGDKLEIVVVEDITKEGAFDEAVKGIDAIEHTASPFHMKADDPQEVIAPAVKGTVGILQSALKNGSSVKRIVVTSSSAAILEVLPEPKVFNEFNWNEQSIKEVKENGRDAAPGAKYRASKTLAEKAAWDFYHEHKKAGKIAWDLVVLNPPYVFGPVIHDVSSPKALNTSAFDWYNTVLKDGFKTGDGLTKQGSCWVDVRDLAEVHALALTTEAAAGERTIISAGPFVWQDWINTANSLSPNPAPSHNPLPRGETKDFAPVYQIQYDTAKAARIFGLKYRTREEVTRDTLADIERRGW